jgi:hypothetical protein
MRERLFFYSLTEGLQRLQPVRCNGYCPVVASALFELENAAHGIIVQGQGTAGFTSSIKDTFRYPADHLLHGLKMVDHRYLDTIR